MFGLQKIRFSICQGDLLHENQDVSPTDITTCFIHGKTPCHRNLGAALRHRLEHEDTIPGKRALVSGVYVKDLSYLSEPIFLEKTELKLWIRRSQEGSVAWRAPPGCSART